MLKNHTCVSVACDAPACDEAFDGYGEDEATAHFDDVAEAVKASREYGDSWFIGADGIALCGDDDEAHLAWARAWLDAGKLSADEIAALRETYPQFAGEYVRVSEVEGQLALVDAGSAVTA